MNRIAKQISGIVIATTLALSMFTAVPVEMEFEEISITIINITL